MTALRWCYKKDPDGQSGRETVLQVKTGNSKHDEQEDVPTFDEHRGWYNEETLPFDETWE